MPAARSAATAPSATPRINGGTLAPGNSIGTLTVQGNLVFTAAASYLVEVIAGKCRPHQCHRHGDARRRNRQCALRAGQLRRQAIHHPQRRRRRAAARSTRLSTPTCRRTSVEPELRCQQRLSQSDAELHAAADRRPQRQPAERRQRAASASSTRTGGIPLVFGGADAGGPDAGFRRDRRPARSRPRSTRWTCSWA